MSSWTKEDARRASKKSYYKYQEKRKIQSNNYHHTHRDAILPKMRARTRLPKNRFKHSVDLAHRRDLEWSISFEDFNKFLVQDCYYCGGKLPETGSGLDRKDNSRGYYIENVVPCCYTCNKIKGDNLTFEEMVAVSLYLKKLRGIL